MISTVLLNLNSESSKWKVDRVVNFAGWGYRCWNDFSDTLQGVQIEEIYFMEAAAII